MGNTRLENSFKNSMVALILKILQIAFPFVSRTIIIRELGLSYVGIAGLFTSLFGLLGIAELGVGSALLRALYEPIKRGQKERINAVLNVYRKAYAAIGFFILVIGVALTPYIKFMIKKGTYPDGLNLYFIYYLHLFNTVITYLLYSYKALILEAHQMERKVSTIKIITSLGSYVIQLAVLCLTKNYYYYIIIASIFSVISVLIIARVADKTYPELRPSGTLNLEEKKTIIKDIKALFCYKIGGTVFNSFDSMVISVIFGALLLGIYNNYYYIVSSVSIMLLVVYKAILPSVGNSTVDSDNTANLSRFMKLVLLDGWAVGFCSICICCLMEPFILLWIGEDGRLGTPIAILFSIYFFLWRALDPVTIYKDALGLWNDDKWRPLISAALNLILNIFLTLRIGLAGILISSIVSMALITYPFSIRYLFRYFKTGFSNYVSLETKIILVTIVSACVTFCACNMTPIPYNLLGFVCRVLICVLLPNFIYLGAFARDPVFWELLHTFNIVNKRSK